MDELKQHRNAILLFGHHLKKLVADRNKINLEIDRVADLITAHANFLPAADRSAELQKVEGLLAAPPGFTDSVRGVLRNNPGYSANATGVRDMLIRSGYNLSAYTNPMASIHTILKRLAERGEVDTSVSGGELYYRWKQDVPKRNKAFYGE